MGLNQKIYDLEKEIESNIQKLFERLDEVKKDTRYLSPFFYPDDKDGFLIRVYSEVKRARQKFPSSEGAMTALTEEVGELAKALIDQDLKCVYDEAIQVAAMAMRVATEGDPSLNNLRNEKGLDVPLRKESEN